MRNVPRLLVIDPAMTSAEEQGAREVIGDWPGEARILQPCLLQEGPAPGFGYDWDAVVLMGSKASVHEDHPWLRDLGAWLDPLLTGEVVRPLLGICFGHQLLAHRLGATVGFVHEDRHKESGFTTTELSGSRLLPGRRTLRVVVSHYEQAAAPPAGFRAVATRPHVPVDGMEHERLPIASFQFHPEGRERFAEKCGLDPAGIDARLRADCGELLAAFRRAALASGPAPQGP